MLASMFTFPWFLQMRWPVPAAAYKKGPQLLEEIEDNLGDTCMRLRQRGRGFKVCLWV